MNINILQNRFIIFFCLGILLFSLYYYFQATKEKVIELYPFEKVYQERFQIKLVDSNGKENGFLVDKVTDEVSKEKGLMFVNQMKPQNGLLFEFNPSIEVSFWMKNTYIPLDIIYIDENDTVINISKNAKILDSSINYNSSGKVKYVLEINAGLSDRLEIIVGDKLTIETYAK